MQTPVWETPEPCYNAKHRTGTASPSRMLETQTSSHDLQIQVHIQVPGALLQAEKGGAVLQKHRQGTWTSCSFPEEHGWDSKDGTNDGHTWLLAQDKLSPRGGVP